MPVLSSAVNALSAYFIPHRRTASRSSCRRFGCWPNCDDRRLCLWRRYATDPWFCISAAFLPSSAATNSWRVPRAEGRIRRHPDGPTERQDRVMHRRQLVVRTGHGGRRHGVRVHDGGTRSLRSRGEPSSDVGASSPSTTRPSISTTVIIAGVNVASSPPVGVRATSSPSRIEMLPEVPMTDRCRGAGGKRLTTVRGACRASRQPRLSTAAVTGASCQGSADCRVEKLSKTSLINASASSVMPPITPP